MSSRLRPGVVDLPSMPHRWLLPYQDLSSCSDAELERGKGALHHVKDPRSPQDYILEILRAERAGTYACPVRDIDRPEMRELLEAVGLTAYDRDLSRWDLWMGPLRRRHFCDIVAAGTSGDLELRR